MKNIILIFLIVILVVSGVYLWQSLTVFKGKQIFKPSPTSSPTSMPTVTPIPTSTPSPVSEFPCWQQCSEEVTKLKLGTICNEKDFPLQIDRDSKTQVRGCAVTQVGDTVICENGRITKGIHPPLGRGNNVITPFCK